MAAEFEVHEEFAEKKARKTALMALLSHWQPDISRNIKVKFSGLRVLDTVLLTHSEKREEIAWKMKSAIASNCFISHAISSELQELHWQLTSERVLRLSLLFKLILLIN